MDVAIAEAPPCTGKRVIAQAIGQLDSVAAPMNDLNDSQE